MNQFGSTGVFPMMGGNQAAMYGPQMHGTMGSAPPFGQLNPVGLHFNPMAPHVGGPRHPRPMQAMATNQGPVQTSSVGQKTNASDLFSRQSRVYVGSVSPKLSREQLISIFIKYGKVTGLSLLKGFAFVQYDNPNSARTAVTRENNKFYSGMSFECNVVSDEKKQLPQQGAASGSGTTGNTALGGTVKGRLAGSGGVPQATASNLSVPLNNRRQNNNNNSVATPVPTTGAAPSTNASALQRNPSLPSEATNSSVSNLKRIAVSTTKSIQPPAKKAATVSNNAQKFQTAQLPSQPQQQQQKPKVSVGSGTTSASVANNSGNISGNNNNNSKKTTNNSPAPAKLPQVIHSVAQCRSEPSSALSEEPRPCKLGRADLLLCGQCRALFDDVASFQQHKDGCCENVPDALWCFSCNQMLTSPWALLRHVQNDHNFQIYLTAAAGEPRVCSSAAEGRRMEKSSELKRQQEFEQGNNNGRTCDKFNRHSRSEDNSSTTTDKAESCNDGDQPDSSDDISNAGIQASSNDATGGVDEEILLAVKDDL